VRKTVARMKIVRLDSADFDERRPPRRVPLRRPILLLPGTLLLEDRRTVVALIPLYRAARSMSLGRVPWLAVCVFVPLAPRRRRLAFLCWDVLVYVFYVPYDISMRMTEEPCILAVRWHWGRRGRPRPFPAGCEHSHDEEETIDKKEEWHCWSSSSNRCQCAVRFGGATVFGRLR